MDISDGTYSRNRTTGLSVLRVRHLLAVLPPEGEIAMSSPNMQGWWWAEEPGRVRTSCLTARMPRGPFTQPPGESLLPSHRHAMSRAMWEKAKS